MTWVKVCGLTSYEAVAAAIDGGADAIGLVLAPGSPREITVERATALASNVTVATFIVTVGLRPGETLALAEQVGATGIQAHGDWALDVAAEAAEAGYLSLVPVAESYVSLRRGLEEREHPPQVVAEVQRQHPLEALRRVPQKLFGEDGHAMDRRVHLHDAGTYRVAIQRHVRNPFLTWS